MLSEVDKIYVDMVETYKVYVQFWWKSGTKIP